MKKSNLFGRHIEKEMENMKTAREIKNAKEAFRKEKFTSVEIRNSKIHCKGQNKFQRQRAREREKERGRGRGREREKKESHYKIKQKKGSQRAINI